MSLKLALFDCDGTLVDSARLIHEVMARTFEAHALPRPTLEQTKSVIGLTLDIAIARRAAFCRHCRDDGGA